MRTASAIPLLLALAAWLPASTAAGDWIVMRDGTRVETRGPWEVRGRQIVFTRPDGSLSSLREADVDLEASAAATAAAAEPAAAEPAAEPRARPPVLVLTDADLPAPEAVPEDPDGDDDEARDEPAVPSADVAEPEPVAVVSWEERDTGEAIGLEIHGRLRNSGPRVAAEIEVTVTVRGEEGEPPVRAAAFLGSQALAPGASTTFRALLPGIVSLPGEPSFEVRSEAFDIGGRPADRDETGEGEGVEEVDEEAENLASGGGPNPQRQPR